MRFRPLNSFSSNSDFEGQLLYVKRTADCARPEVYRRPKIFGQSRSFLTFGYTFGTRQNVEMTTENVQPKRLTSIAITVVIIIGQRKKIRRRRKILKQERKELREKWSPPQPPGCAYLKHYN